MKSTALLTAMFSGLCAGAMAAPIHSPDRNEPATLPDLFNYPVIGPDFDLSSPSIAGPSFAGEDRSKPALVDNAAPEPGVPESDAEAGVPHVPDPSPSAPITAGVLFLGATVATLSRTRRKRHSNRGRRVRIRELTALR
jgi:hypothetical protein